MSKPRLLDLFCGAGGCSVGYARAGFEVVGVDITPQPNYPYRCFQADARDVLREWEIVERHGDFMQVVPLLLAFDAIHASPPCQNDTAYKRRPDHVAAVPELIAPTREALERTGLPYVIENVPGAPLHNPVQLCGSSFGLGVRRHRLFETSFPLMASGCAHGQQAGDYPQATNRVARRKTAEVGVWRIPLESQKRAMGVDWDVTLPELSQAIPPVYTEHIGNYLLAHLKANAPAGSAL